MSTFHATTVLTVRKKGKVVVISDGQVTRGDIVLKSNAKKVRRIGQGENVIVGFAGSAADALTLMERLVDLVLYTRSTDETLGDSPRKASWPIATCLY